MSEWQPIETAPKDGTAILIWEPKRYPNQEWIDNEEAGHITFYDDSRYSVGYWRPWGGWGNRNNDPRPTHWMSLPAPPKMEGRK